ncbi:MAG: GyrI-like domain-containing protein [Chloroflexi bacterium]|nr:GyrI-like domain-containing protein [Chloroflexota bacterium]
MKKLDLKKQYKDLYNPSAKRVVVVKVPRFNFIMVKGTIPANTPVAEAPDYLGALETLYGLSYTIKFACRLRKKNPVDFPVMSLESLWWTKDSHQKFTVGHKDDWFFTALIMQPEPVTKDLFEQACEQLREKKNPAMLDQARFESFEEGLSMQIMHIGPYSAEPATIEKMVAFAAENSYRTHGKHHEIYLGDPRRAKPEKLKTVLRHPIGES